MWWKIYFWVYLVIVILGIIAASGKLQNFSLGDWLGGFSEIMLVLGTYSYVFKKKILSSDLWKKLLWAFVLLLIFSFVAELNDIQILYFLKSGLQTTISDQVIATMIYLPALYTLYQLGNKRYTKSK